MKNECWHRRLTVVSGATITRTCKYCGSVVRFTYPLGFPEYVRRFLGDE